MNDMKIKIGSKWKFKKEFIAIGDGRRSFIATVIAVNNYEVEYTYISRINGDNEFKNTLNIKLFTDQLELVLEEKIKKIRENL
jgi:hypothetical protein